MPGAFGWGGDCRCLLDHATAWTGAARANVWPLTNVADNLEWRRGRDMNPYSRKRNRVQAHEWEPNAVREGSIAVLGFNGGRGV